MKHTYAHRANLISKRFPNADRSASEKLARDGELFALFQDQEQEKQSRQAQQPQQGNEFGPGGFTGDNPFRQRYIQSFEDLMSNPKENFTGQFGQDYFDEYKLAMGNDRLNQEFDPTSFDYNPEKTGATSKDSMLSTYLNLGSGAVAAGANLANMLSVKDAKLIEPSKVNPTAKFRGLDLSSYEAALQNQLQTTNYGLLQSGADFDTVSGGVQKANQGFASSLGQVKVEEQRINNAEGARIDDIMNKGQYYNAQNLTQARIDQVSRQDDREQKRRNYLTALSENLQGMLKDESDRAYADELDPTLAKIAALQGIYSTGKTQ